MTKNGLSNVKTSFDLIISEMDNEIAEINKEGSKAFEKGNYAEAKKIIGTVQKITELRNKLMFLRKQWEAISSTKGKTRNKKIVNSSSKGRLSRGLRTSEESFYVPILKTLVDLGGDGKVREVVNEVGNRLRNILKDVDYKPLPSKPDQLRWENAVRWARNEMVNSGLLKSKSPRGIWEISEKGRKYLNTRQGIAN